MRNTIPDMHFAESPRPAYEICGRIYGTGRARRGRRLRSSTSKKYNGTPCAQDPAFANKNGHI
jgi:hypothetical protein